MFAVVRVRGDCVPAYDTHEAETRADYRWETDCEYDTNVTQHHETPQPRSNRAYRRRRTNIYINCCTTINIILHFVFLGWDTEPQRLSLTVVTNATRQCGMPYITGLAVHSSRQDGSSKQKWHAGGVGSIPAFLSTN